MSNRTFIVLVFLALFVGAVTGYSLSHKEVSLGTSAVGTTNGTQKIATITFAPATPAATSTSILNSDSNDRIIDEEISYCSGLGSSRVAFSGGGLASNGLTFSAATTSTSAPNTVTNTNLTLNVSIATTTGFAFVSTSSPSVITTFVDGVPTSTSTQSVISRVWASGSYLTFWSNATNTATCTVGVRYFSN